MKNLTPLLITGLFLFIFGAGNGLYVTGLAATLLPKSLIKSPSNPSTQKTAQQNTTSQIAQNNNSNQNEDTTSPQVLGQQEGRPADKEVLGYLPYWMLDSAPLIQYDKLTYLAYFDLEANDKGEFTQVLPDFTAHIGWIRWNGDRFAGVIQEAHQNNIRVLLTVSMLNNDNIKALLDCSECQTKLTDNIINELTQKDADGLIIDIEYSGEIAPEQPQKLTTLVSNIRTELNRRLPGSTLMINTTSDTPIKPTLWQLSELVKTVDYIAIMGYDFHNTGSKTAGPIAPLGTDAHTYTYDYQRAINDYLSFVAPEKLIFVVPYYGYDWPVENEILSSKTTSNGKAATLIYSTIVKDLLTRNLKPKWDYEGQTPWYNYTNDQGQLRQVHYDNAESLAKKYDLINSKSIHGIGIWALAYDGDNPELWQLLENKFSILKNSPRPDPYNFE